MAKDPHDGGDESHQFTVVLPPAVHAMEKAQAEAIELFESHPDFARVQVRMRERMEEATHNSPASARGGSKAGLEYVLVLFDLRAEAFCGLVTDIRTQNAFILVLEFLERAAWQEYTGWPIEILHPVSAEAEGDLTAIRARVQQWRLKGYRRLVPNGGGNTPVEAEPAAPSAVGRGSADVSAQIVPAEIVLQSLAWPILKHSASP